MLFQNFLKGVFHILHRFLHRENLQNTLISLVFLGYFLKSPTDRQKSVGLFWFTEHLLK